MNDRPIAYKYWKDGAKDRFDERVAIMREGNRVPDNQPLPDLLRQIAITEAEEHNVEPTLPSPSTCFQGILIP